MSTLAYTGRRREEARRTIGWNMEYAGSSSSDWGGDDRPMSCVLTLVVYDGKFGKDGCRSAIDACGGWS
jgi:hypothetical protein